MVKKPKFLRLSRRMQVIITDPVSSDIIPGIRKSHVGANKQMKRR